MAELRQSVRLSVSTTERPALTSRIAFENFRFASLKPTRMSPEAVFRSASTDLKCKIF